MVTGADRPCVAHAPAALDHLWSEEGADKEEGEGRTENIMSIFVTLEVSKLSGWLNADASCRESIRRACSAGRGIRVGGQQAVDDRGASSMHRRGRDCRLVAGQGEKRTSNM